MRLINNLFFCSITLFKRKNLFYNHIFVCFSTFFLPHFVRDRNVLHYASKCISFIIFFAGCHCYYYMFIFISMLIPHLSVLVHLCECVCMCGSMYLWTGMFAVSACKWNIFYGNVMDFMAFDKTFCTNARK